MFHVSFAAFEMLGEYTNLVFGEILSQFLQIWKFAEISATDALPVKSDLYNERENRRFCPNHVDIVGPRLQIQIVQLSEDIDQVCNVVFDDFGPVCKRENLLSGEIQQLC